MTSDRPDGLLTTVPLGGLLVLLVRAAACADRREEFLGDLVEEARLRQGRHSEAEVAAWVWSETLRSLPALLGLRLRRLTGALVAGRGPTPARVGGGLVAARASHRGLTLSVGISVGAHALVLAVALGWLFTRVETVSEAYVPLETVATFVPEPAPLADEHASVASFAARERESAPTPRRVRAGRRPPPSASPLPPAGPTAGPALPGTDSPPTAALTNTPPAVRTDAALGDGSGPVALPPRIADKRCVACPPPQLHPAYARLARGQDMLIRTCVSTAGEVTRVDVLRGFDATVSREVVATVRHWRLVPYLLDGHPVPFCYATRFIFANG